MGAIFGATAMILNYEHIYSPIKTFSRCLNQKTIYLDSEPYLGFNELRDCVELYQASLLNN